MAERKKRKSMARGGMLMQYSPPNDDASLIITRTVTAVFFCLVDTASIGKHDIFPPLDYLQTSGFS